MKRSLFTVILALVLVCCSLASAEVISGTPFSITLPSDWEAEALDEDDIADNMVNYWCCSSEDIDLAVYYYVDDDTDISDFLEYCRADKDTVSCGMYQKLCGLDFGYWHYIVKSGREAYYVFSFFATAGDDFIEFCFFAGSTSSLSTAEAIMNTLSVGGSAATDNSGRLAIGNTGYTLLMPVAYDTDELTAEDIEDDMTAFYFTAHNDIAVYVFDSRYRTTAEIVEDFASDEDCIQSGSTVISSGMEFAYGITKATYSGDDYFFIDYLTLTPNGTIQLSFAFSADDIAEASAEAAAIVDSIY